MVPMRALVGFSDPVGTFAPGNEFQAPTADDADRLELAGVAERVKAEKLADRKSSND